MESLSVAFKDTWEHYSYTCCNVDGELCASGVNVMFPFVRVSARARVSYSSPRSAVSARAWRAAAAAAARCRPRGTAAARRRSERGGGPGWSAGVLGSVSARPGPSSSGGCPPPGTTSPSAGSSPAGPVAAAAAAAGWTSRFCS